jgi:hypothetical protein
VIEKNGGRDRDRTCDPYDVNVPAGTERAELRHLLRHVWGITGHRFRLRSRIMGSVNRRALRNPAALSPSQPGGG